MHKLIGSWITDPATIALDPAAEQVMIDFAENGRMVYTILKADREQLIFLTYRVAGDFIFSEQPSHPKPNEEKTQFLITDDDKLILIYEEQIHHFIRAE